MAADEPIVYVVDDGLSVRQALSSVIRSTMRQALDPDRMARRARAAMARRTHPTNVAWRRMASVRSVLCMLPTRATIAVVDDDAGVRTALRQLLRSAGFDAVAFGSAEEFLASRKQVDIKCLIADINLPGMSGVALVQALAADEAPACVVLITGRDDPHTLELIGRAGGVPVLRKPFSDEALFEAIHVGDDDP